MKKKVLLIDNDNIKATLESIEEYAEADGDLQYDVQCLDWFNPVDRKFYDDQGEYNFELTRKYLIEEFLEQKIDVIGCDFNLHATHKALTYKIIETIRQFNKSASVFIYSGGMNRSTLQMFGDEGKKPAEGYLKIAMSSNICAYVNNKGTLPDRVISILKSPSVELQIEDFLMQNESLKLEHSIELFRGKQLFEISKEIRIQSENGIAFTKDIIERGLSHIIDLNSID